VSESDDARLASLGYQPQLRRVLGLFANFSVALTYLALPTGLDSPRAFFNRDWITLTVMVVIALVGAAYFLIARPDRGVARHVHDELEPTGAERALT
jgi:hypothetical protein